MNPADSAYTSANSREKDKLRVTIRNLINEGVTNLQDLILKVGEVEHDTRLIGKTIDYELFAYHLQKSLGGHGKGMPLQYLPEFLLSEGLAEDEDDSVVKKRSLLRHLRGDTRFRLEGPNRNRYVYFSSNAEGTQAQRDIADLIIREMLERTMQRDMLVGRVLVSSLVVSDSEAFESSLRLLEDLFIVRRHGDYLEWTNKNFIGYEPGVKRSSALNLPNRTWDAVWELISRFENRSLMQPGEEHPILNLAFRRGPPFNNSEIIELAIEHLRSTMKSVDANESH